MTIAPGTLQDNVRNATRTTAVPGQTAIAVVNPDGSDISGGGGGGSSSIQYSESTAISVGTSAVEAKVGPTALASRKFVSVTPTNGIVYFGSDASVTTATGTPIQSTVTATFSFSDNAPVYLIADSTVDVRIMEGS